MRSVGLGLLLLAICALFGAASEVPDRNESFPRLVQGSDSPVHAWSGSWMVVHQLSERVKDGPPLRIALAGGTTLRLPDFALPLRPHPTGHPVRPTSERLTYFANAPPAISKRFIRV